MRLQKQLVLAAVVVAAVLGSGQSSLGRRRAAQHPEPPPPAPVTSADSYTLNGATLTIAAPGVLANDTVNNATIASYGASTGKEQTAGTATSTSKGGTITLNADGSFTYTPAANFSGSDTLVYLLKNAGGESSATVTITVTPQQTTPDFKVTSPGFFFAFSGVSGQNPVITLQRGRTYRFDVDTDDIHPFEIINAPAGSVTGNNTSAGIVTFTVPATAQDYAYKCTIHGFGNTIKTTP